MFTKEQKELCLLIRKLERALRVIEARLQETPGDKSIQVAKEKLERLIQKGKSFSRLNPDSP
jgi:hypothetical protein